MRRDRGLIGGAADRPGAVAALTAATMVAFAANSLLCRMALGAGWLDPVSFTTLRLGSGAVALVLIARAAGSGRDPGAAAGSSAAAGSWPSAAALFVYALGFSLAYVSLTTGMGALILFAAVQATMIVAALRAGERLSPLQWTGFVAALAGLVYLVRPGLAAPDPLGALLMAAAGVAWGVYSIRGRGAIAPVAMTAGNFARAAPLAVLVSLVAWGGGVFTTRGIALALVSGVVTSGLGYALWYRALRGLTTTQASVVQLTVPALAAMAGVAFLAEELSVRLLVASALILGGVGLAVESRSPAR